MHTLRGSTYSFIRCLRRQPRVIPKVYLAWLSPLLKHYSTLTYNRFPKHKEGLAGTVESVRQKASHTLRRVNGWTWIQLHFSSRRSEQHDLAWFQGHSNKVPHPLGDAAAGCPWLSFAESPAAVATACFPLKLVLLESEADTCNGFTKLNPGTLV